MKIILCLSLTLLTLPNVFGQTSITQKIDQMQQQVKKIKEQKSPKKFDPRNVSLVKQKIKCLYEIDNYVRKNLAAYLHDPKALPEIQKYLNKTDLENTNQLKQILSFHGWLTISKFGKETDSQASQLVEHADFDPFFQASTAFLLEQLSKIGQTNKQNFAYLYDRIALKFHNLGLKQRYGTQARIEGNKVILLPYEGTLQEVNKRRKQVGLASLESRLKELKKQSGLPMQIAR